MGPSRKVRAPGPDSGVTIKEKALGVGVMRLE